jgi:hypothetical protein
VEPSGSLSDSWTPDLSLVYYSWLRGRQTHAAWTVLNRSGYSLYSHHIIFYKADKPCLNLPHFSTSFRGKRIKISSQLLIMFSDFSELE